MRTAVPNDLSERPTQESTAYAYRWLVLIFVSTAQLMVVLDATIVNIALPSAQADLGFPDSQRQWVVTAYALAFGSLLLLGGRIGDTWGRKRTFLVALAAFALASGVGGAAPNFAVLVVARALQGVAGALLAPAALSTLVTTFRDPRERGKAFGVFSTVAVGGSAVGLILGGVLTEYLSWRWCMYVNVVFAAVAFAGARRYMAEAKPPIRPRMDGLGTVLAAAGLFGVVFGLSQAEQDGWGSPVTVGSLTVGGLLLIAFVAVERRVSHPLLPLRVVADRSRAMAFLAVGIAGTAIFGLFLFMTYYLQLVKGFSPAVSGLAYLPMTGCIVLSSNTSNIVLLPRFGPRVLISTGMLLGFLGMGYLSLIDVHSSYAGAILPGLMVMGFAMGMVMAPAMNTATTGVAPQDSGVAAAVVSTMQQIGGSIGTAVTSTIAASVTATYAAAHAPVRGFDAAAATHGYTTVFLVVACVFGGGGLLAAAVFQSTGTLAATRAAAMAGPSVPAAAPVHAEV
jgi:EmrB/QacA subfamily drug resistance transporter